MGRAFDETNREQAAAHSMLTKTRKSFFLAGRAGTGKTTFLKNFMKETDRNYVVLAPTGIAAINAGGQTIHSFFGLDFGVLGPGSIGKMNSEKISLIRHIDGIIIDEVSMVRCDVMDAIDRTLRYFRKSYAPFGGLQMVLVGDIFQLEPIATREDRIILDRFYGSAPYFFYRSHAVMGIELPKIEFKKIYRQSDKKFIDILEHLRTGRMTREDFYAINRRVTRTADRSALSITLTSTKAAAQRINDSHLASIEGEPTSFNAIFSGETKSKSDIVEEVLTLKLGAHVMFTKNDKDRRWVNGTIGRVSALEEDMVKVTLEDDTEYEVSREVWEFVDHNYDEDSRTCIKEVVGTARQFPLRLAWAITIHKSQSLTFDHVAIDFGKGAFSNGQAYVALSRARTLDGLELVRPITTASVRVSDDAKGFASDFNDSEILDREIMIGEALSPFYGKRDFDGSALTLLSMARAAAEKGDVKLTECIFSRMMEYVADDSCIAHALRELPPIHNAQPGLFTAACLLYSGNIEGAEDSLHSFIKSRPEDIDTLYLFARCKEEKKDWNKAESIYNVIISIYNDHMANGKQNPSFRKALYRIAVLNESIYDDPGIDILKGLINENPNYIPYHLALRQMVLRRGILTPACEGEAATNSLVKDFHSSHISGETFRAELQDAYSNGKESWTEYRKYIREFKTDKEQQAEGTTLTK